MVYTRASIGKIIFQLVNTTFGRYSSNFALFKLWNSSFKIRLWVEIFIYIKELISCSQKEVEPGKFAVSMMFKKSAFQVPGIGSQYNFSIKAKVFNILHFKYIFWKQYSDYKESQKHKSWKTTWRLLTDILEIMKDHSTKPNMWKLVWCFLNFTKFFNRGLVYGKGRIFEVKSSACPMFSGTPCIKKTQEIIFELVMIITCSSLHGEIVK